MLDVLASHQWNAAQPGKQQQVPPAVLSPVWAAAAQREWPPLLPETPGEVSRRHGPSLLSLSDVTSLSHRYLPSLPHTGGDVGAV